MKAKKYTKNLGLGGYITDDLIYELMEAFAAHRIGLYLEEQSKQKQ